MTWAVAQLSLILNIDNIINSIGRKKQDWNVGLIRRGIKFPLRDWPASSSGNLVFLCWLLPHQTQKPHSYTSPEPTQSSMDL